MLSPLFIYRLVVQSLGRCGFSLVLVTSLHVFLLGHACCVMGCLGMHTHGIPKG